MTIVLPDGPQNITFDNNMQERETPISVTFRFRENNLINLKDIHLHYNTEPSNKDCYLCVKSVSIFNDDMSNRISYELKPGIHYSNYLNLVDNYEYGLENLCFDSHDELINVKLELEVCTCGNLFTNENIVYSNLNLTYNYSSIKDASNPSRTVHYMKIKASERYPYNMQMIFNQSHGNFLEKVIIETPNKTQHKNFNKNLLNDDYMYNRVCSCDTYFYFYLLK